MNALLFVDLLGARNRWHQEGRAGAENAFALLERMVVKAAEDHGADNVIAGVIESDAAAIVCSSPNAAVSVGIGLWRRTFSIVADRRFGRPWLRGAILPYDGNLGLRSQRSAGTSNIVVSQYEGSLLDAIAVEKGGFKGMRLLIADELVDGPLRDAHCVRLPTGGPLHVFKRVTNSVYPGRLAAGYQDVLWMACSDAEESKTLSRTMNRRLRWAAKDSDEFLQAASTQVLFHEYAAILGSLTGQTHETSPR